MTNWTHVENGFKDTTWADQTCIKFDAVFTIFNPQARCGARKYAVCARKIDGTAIARGCAIYTADSMSEAKTFVESLETVEGLRPAFEQQARTKRRRAA